MSALRARSVRQADGLDPSRALQRVLYRSAKSDPGRRFHAVYGHVARSDVLWRAWRDVRAHRGAPGVDGVTIDAVEAGGVDGFLDDLSCRLAAGVYRPAPVRRVDIPKPGRPGEFRSLGIPTVADRVVMTAAKLVLEPIFEADFVSCSYGFRPRRSAHQACEAVRKAANAGHDWVLDADVSDCFGSIDHDALMREVARRVSDRRMLKLLRAWLRAGVFEEAGVREVTSGTPQGSPISPLLSNIALHVLDRAWQQCRRLGVLVRYADDFVILCATRERAEAAQQRVAEVLAGFGLRLHPDKTRIVCLTRGAQGFEFCGFHHHKVGSWRRRDRYWLQRWPSAQAMRSIRSKVRDLTHRRNAVRDWPSIVTALNRVLRGWGNYFAVGNSARKFATIDSYVHERVAMLASVKHQMPHRRNWTTRFDVEWFKRLGIYRLNGTVRWATTHASR